MSLDISLHLPFDEAIEWAKARDVVLPDDYYGNRIGIARAQAFSVAGLASLDQLDLVKKSLDKTLASGVSFHDWKQQVARGDIPLDLPAHRLDNIFRTNLQGAYMAGHWKGVEETKLTHPYLMYEAVNDTRTRPTHKAMDNIIKPVDAPFWQANYPPNGYRCRCTVRKLTEKKAKALGGETADDAIPQHAKADEGWNYNVGLNRGAGIKQAVEDLLAKTTLKSEAVDRFADTANSLLDKVKITTYQQAGEYGRSILARLKSEGVDFDFSRFDVSKIESYKAHEINSVAVWRDKLLDALHTEVGTKGVMNNVEFGSGAKKIGLRAMQKLPDSWTEAADSVGKLVIKRTKARGFAWTADRDYDRGINFGGGHKITEPIKKGFGYIITDTSSTVEHELVHRVQSALPELDNIFQQLHKDRTKGDKLEKLKDVTKNPDYQDHEVTRKDGYYSAYMGREYDNGDAKEVMTMALEPILGGLNKIDLKTDKEIRRYLKKNIDLIKFVNVDREMFEITIGLLFGWKK